MARGTQIAFDVFSEAPGETIHNLTPTTGDTIKVALVSNTAATLGAQTNLSALTEVTGGTEYVAGGATSAITAWSRTGAVTSLGLSDVSWAQDASGPQDIRCAVVWNSSKVGQDDLLTYIDLTLDGTTPVDLQAAPLSIDLSTNPPIVSTRS